MVGRPIRSASRQGTLSEHSNGYVINNRRLSKGLGLNFRRDSAWKEGVKKSNRQQFAAFLSPYDTVVGADGSSIR